jgi:magnesium-transporting ATPase (P-type)
MVSPLTVENVLWSNTVLAAGSAIGFVIYTGAETRAVLNTSHPETKVGLLDLEINRLAKVSMFLIIVMCVLRLQIDSLYRHIRSFTRSRCPKRFPRRVVRLHSPIFDPFLVHHSDQVTLFS